MTRFAVSLLCALGLLLTGAFAGWQARGWKADSDALSGVREAAKRYDRAAAKVEQVAADMLGYDGRTETLRVEATRTIREIYRDAPPVPAVCALDPAARGVLEAQRQRANAAAAGEPEPVMPENILPAGPDDRPGPGRVGG